MTPEVVTLATLLALDSVNQRLPSGPGAMPSAPLLAVGMAYSVTTPEVVTLATLFAPCSVNQRLPSGPGAIATGPLLVLGVGYEVMSPTAARATPADTTSAAAKITNAVVARADNVDDRFVVISNTLPYPHPPQRATSARMRPVTPLQSPWFPCLPAVRRVCALPRPMDSVG